jgi:3-phenylpropionate/cinnamic acid dioxygenase small subunit
MSTNPPTWEIHNALARIAHLADGGDIEDYLDMFTADAVWEINEVPQTGTKPDRREGRAHIRDGVVTRRAAGIQGPGTATQHVVHTIEVHPGPEDGTATSHTYYTFFNNTRVTPNLVAAGQYRDTWKLDGGTWKLAHRHIVAG